jgi:glutathione synthase/RimK-type ligase-like ATP-grasp enzyme
MILLCGIQSEPPLALVREQLDQIGAPYVFFNQRQFAAAELTFEIAAGRVGGRLRLNGDSYALEDFTAVFTRMMDDRSLPELEGEPAGSPARRSCRALHDGLMRWAEVAPARVVNRAGPMSSNFSKPYQAQLIRRHGFETPATLITNDPDIALAFRERHGRVIFKSISGVRSIVRQFEDGDLKRLNLIRLCPTQFQEFVEGTNVRVHTVGRKVFATAVSTDATDYRYAHRQTGVSADLREVELADWLAERCLALAEGLGLAFAGIDLKVTPDQRVYCFEVNPSPAFSYYEGNSGQPISRAVAEYLAGAD